MDVQNVIDINVAEIIRVAATSSLGIIALLCMLLSVIAYALFKKSDDRYKLAVFGLAFIGSVLLAIALLSASKQQDAAPLAKNSTAVSTITTKTIPSGANKQSSLVPNVLVAKPVARNYPPRALSYRAETAPRMVWKGLAPDSRAVSTVVRRSASASAAHLAR